MPQYDGESGAIQYLNFKLKPIFKKCSDDDDDDDDDDNDDVNFSSFCQTQYNPADKTNYKCAKKTEGHFKIQCAHPGVEITVLKDGESQKASKAGIQRKYGISEADTIEFQLSGEIPLNLEITAHVTVVKKEDTFE